MHINIPLGDNMKLKNYLISLIALSFIVSSCKPSKKQEEKLTIGQAASLDLATEKLSIDTEASTITWMGQKKIGDDKHMGTLNISSGTIGFDEDKLVAGNIEIDMKSIKNTDLKDEKDNNKLVTHLNSDEFFGVDKHPTAKFEIVSAEKMEDSYKVTGNLTVKGKTGLLTTTANIDKAGKTVTATVTFDRAKYDVKYGSKSYFDLAVDKIIEDEVQLTLNLKLK